MFVFDEVTHVQPSTLRQELYFLILRHSWTLLLLFHIDERVNYIFIALHHKNMSYKIFQSTGVSLDLTNEYSVSK